jgi:DNA sulfur modification protein DndC
LVEQDKSMSAMIQNDHEKEWMMPLLEIRNALDFRPAEGTAEHQRRETDRHLRDFRRMSGSVQLYFDREIPGPYLQSARETWLRKLLKAQTWIRRNGPKDVRDITLITLEELQEIRRIWVVDKHEIEDVLPRIYQEETGEPYPGKPLDDNLVLGAEQMDTLRELCGEDRLHYELTRELLSVTNQQRSSGRRSGLYDQLEKTFSKHFYDDKEDALDRAKRLLADRNRVKDRSGAVAEESGDDVSLSEEVIA